MMSRRPALLPARPLALPAAAEPPPPPGGSTEAAGLTHRARDIKAVSDRTERLGSAKEEIRPFLFPR